MSEKITISLGAREWEAILRGLAASGWDAMHAVLSAQLAEVRAGVVAEEPEGRRQFTAAYRATNGNVISLETPNMLREAAEKTVREFAEEDPEGPDYFVVMRILPPWVPVKQEGHKGHRIVEQPRAASTRVPRWCTTCEVQLEPREQAPDA